MCKKKESQNYIKFLISSLNIFELKVPALDLFLKRRIT